MAKSKPFIKLYQCVMDRPDLSIYDKLVFCYLLDKSKKCGVSWISLPNLAKELNFPRQTLARSVKYLRAGGLIWDDIGRNGKEGLATASLDVISAVTAESALTGQDTLPQSGERPHRAVSALTEQTPLPQGGERPHRAESALTGRETPSQGGEIAIFPCNHLPNQELAEIENSDQSISEYYQTTDQKNLSENLSEKEQSSSASKEKQEVTLSLSPVAEKGDTLMTTKNEYVAESIRRSLQRAESNSYPPVASHPPVALAPRVPPQDPTRPVFKTALYWVPTYIESLESAWRDETDKEKRAEARKRYQLAVAAQRQQEVAA